MTSPLARHRTDPAALVFGLVFLVAGLLGIGFGMNWIHHDHGVWIGLGLAAAGLLGLVVIVVDRLRPQRPID
jgi:hypothetical protein